MTELGNKSRIHIGSMLLFLSADKQDISFSNPHAIFKSSSLTCHEYLQEQRRGQIRSRKDFPEGFREFKSIRLTSVEDKRLPRFFNDKASHTDKTDKSNKNDKVPASCNHSISETSVEHKTNVPDNKIGAHFPTPLIK